MTRDIENNSLFPNCDLTVVAHNVGGDGVLRGVHPSKINGVQEKYVKRAADHVNPEGINLLIGDPFDEQTTKHIAYRNNLFPNGTRLSVTGESQLTDWIKNQNEVGKSPIIFGVSYINTPSILAPFSRLLERNSSGVSFSTFGLPEHVIDQHKNKLLLPVRLAELGCPDRSINYASCHYGDLVTKGLEVEAKLREFNADFDIDSGVKTKLQAEEGDGGYTAIEVEDAVDAFELDGVKVSRGKVVVYKDCKRDADHMVVCNSWEAALSESRRYFKANLHTDYPQIKIMRLLDTEISPGQTAFIINGKVYPQVWNLQGGDSGSACVSCETIDVSDSRFMDKYGPYMDQSTRIITSVYEQELRRLESEGYDISKIRASVSFDFLKIGTNEIKYWNKALADPVLKKKYVDNFTKNGTDEYSPRVYNPDKLLVTDGNCRLTNLSAAQIAVANVEGIPLQIPRLLQLAEGSELRLVTRDNWKLPLGLSDPDTIRNLSTDYHRSLRGEGGFIYRMVVETPDDRQPEAGVIYWAANGRDGGPSRVIKEAYEFFENSIKPRRMY